MSGVEVTKAIKQDQTLGKTPAVVMVTAFGQEEIRTAAEEARVDGFLTKPVQQSRLVDTLIEILGQGTAGSGTEVIAAPARDLHGLRVLVGEDNAVNQQIAIELLESAGVRVDVANNGREALEMLFGPDGGAYHAVLMDLQMPIMDGFEATRKIRSDSRFEKLPIIAMTAHAMNEVKEQCLAVGMNDHVVKPIHPETLFATLAKWCADFLGEAGATAPEKVVRTTSVSFGYTGSVSIPGIDTAGGRARMAGHHDTYLKILRQFCDSHADAAREIRQSLLAKDRTTAERVAHTVKGAAGGIGATLLAERASNLERGIRENVESEESLWFFESELNTSVSAILANLPAPIDVNPETIEVSAEAANGVLDQLASYLQESDGEAVDYLSRHAALLRSTLGSQKFPELEQAINNFDFLTALTLLNEGRNSGSAN